MNIKRALNWLAAVGGTIDGTTIGGTTPKPGTFSPLKSKGPAAITTFAGTASRATTNLTFTSAADAILAGYDATNPVLGTTVIVNTTNTMVILSWSSSTIAVVSVSGTIAAGGTINSVQAPIAFGVNSDGTLSWALTPNGLIFGSLGTSTRGIDLSLSGMEAGDYLLYFSDNLYIEASGQIRCTGQLRISDIMVYSQTGLLLQGAYDNVTYRIAIGPGAPTTNSALLIGCPTAIGSWEGDGVSSAGTANITDVGGAAHGLSLAVGDLVHIRSCTTASHKGFYRILTAGATTIVLDRVLAATDTNLSVTFYKDVIGFFPSDETNGQRIMNYSHQNKPLQIGGDVLAATGHSLTSEDVLVGGDLEVDGAVYLDSTLGVSGDVTCASISSSGAINSQKYYWCDDFDDEAATVQLESSLNADFWTTAGTNYAAGNVTYLGGVGGTLKALCAAADNDSVTILGLPNCNTSQNPILEARIKIDTKETAGFYVGFAAAASAAIGTFPANCFLVGMDSDNASTFGATQIIAASNDDNAGVDYDNMGSAIVSDTFVKIKIDLTDTEQPRVWINDTEIAAASITGTVLDATALCPYIVVQNLAGGAIQRFVTVDYVKCWGDRG